MSKKVVIIRHAKSSWANIGQPDYDRPLNERGIKNAPEMGKRLLQYGLQPDMIFSSTAVRAKMTAEAIAEAIGFDAEKITWDKDLYHCNPDKFEDVICSADDAFSTIYIVAHNPGITFFANEAVAHFHTDNIPTCGIVAFSFDSDTWSDYHNRTRKLIQYDFPKNIN